MSQTAQAPLRADDVLVRAQAGDHAAFADIVRQHQSMVFSLACHIVHDCAAAEDVAQEVFLELYRSLARLESGAHLTFWLRRVTSHRCIDRIRRHGRRVELTLAETPEPSVPPCAHDPLLEAHLRRLVAELPAGARAVVTLRYQEDLAPSEIALILDMPVNTVKSHMRRSMACLRAKMTRNGRQG